MNFNRYFQLPTDILSEKLFTTDKDAEVLFRIWIHLNSVSARKDGCWARKANGDTMMKNGHPIILKKGECVISLRDSAQYLGIGKDKLSRMITKLENEGFCDRVSKNCDKKCDRQNTRLYLKKSGFVLIKKHKSATDNATVNIEHKVLESASPEVEAAQDREIDDSDRSIAEFLKSLEEEEDV